MNKRNSMTAQKRPYNVVSISQAQKIFQAKHEKSLNTRNNAMSSDEFAWFMVVSNWGEQENFWGENKQKLIMLCKTVTGERTQSYCNWTRSDKFCLLVSTKILCTFITHCNYNRNSKDNDNFQQFYTRHDTPNERTGKEE